MGVLGGSYTSCESGGIGLAFASLEGIASGLKGYEVCSRTEEVLSKSVACGGESQLDYMHPFVVVIRVQVRPHLANGACGLSRHQGLSWR